MRGNGRWGGKGVKAQRAATICKYYCKLWEGGSVQASTSLSPQLSHLKYRHFKCSVQPHIQFSVGNRVDICALGLD